MENTIYHYKKIFKSNPNDEIIKDIVKLFESRLDCDYDIDCEFIELMLDILEYKSDEKSVIEALDKYYSQTFYCEYCDEKQDDFDHYKHNVDVLLKRIKENSIKNKKIEEEARKYREIVDEYNQLKEQAELFAKSEAYKPDGIISKMIEKEFDEFMESKNKN